MGRRRQTLAVFLQAMEGCQAVVELRNDDTLRGRLARVDDDGGVTLEAAVWTRGPAARGRAPAGAPPPPPQPSPPLDSVYVRGHRIRFIHLPPGVDPAAVVEAKRADAAAARAAARREALTAAHAAGRLAKGDAWEKGD